MKPERHGSEPDKTVSDAVEKVSEQFQTGDAPWF